MFRFLALLLLASCGLGPSQEWNIAIDTTWYPLDTGGRDAQLLGFTTDLIQELGAKEGVSVTLLRTNADMLIPNLQNDSYDAVLGTLTPYLFYEKQFDFSSPFLLTSPVLIVQATSSTDSLEILGGKEVAILAGSSSVLIAERYSTILIRPYNDIPDMLDALKKGTVQAVLLDNLHAFAYTQDLYQGQLKVVSAPLGTMGLRMITLHNENADLLDAFNSLISGLKKSGRYAELARKWSLPDNL